MKELTGFSQLDVNLINVNDVTKVLRFMINAP